MATGPARCTERCQSVKASRLGRRTDRVNQQQEAPSRKARRGSMRQVPPGRTLGREASYKTQREPMSAKSNVELKQGACKLIYGLCAVLALIWINRADRINGRQERVS
jgi:hypothetical protein